MRQAWSDKATMAAVALVCALLLGADRQAIGGQQQGGLKSRRLYKMRPAALTGRVTYSDGAPAREVPVRVWRIAQRKFVCEATTDTHGDYKLPELAAGRYVGVFADRVRVELLVVQEASLPSGPLNVVIPRGRVLFYPIQMAKELASTAEGLPGTLLSSRVLLIGGAATAVAIVGERIYDHNRSHPDGPDDGEQRRRVVSP